MTDAGIHWFPGLGFRPAVWSPPHRADGVDYPRLVPAPDADVPLAKVDPFGHIPASGYAWGTWIPADAAPQIATPSTPVHQTASTIAIPPYWPPQPTYPCRCIVPPVDVPPVAPVPAPASAGLLIGAVAVLFIIRRFK